MYIFLINTHYVLFRRFFLETEPPEVLPTGLTQGFACQHSCAFMCMHKILVHAQHSCACTTLSCMHWRGAGPKKQAAAPRRTLFFGPGLGPWLLQCMHKGVVHAQECCACTRILCMHKNLVHAQYTLLFLHDNKYCSEAFPYQTWDFLVHLHLQSRLRRIQ